MRKLIRVATPALCTLLICSTSYAYEIITEDVVGHTYKSGTLKKDSHRYAVVYEVNDLDKTIKVVKETDLSSKEEWRGGTTYQIVDQPTLSLPGVPTALRAFRVNPRRGNIETISFCNGEYHYSKTTEEYINLFYGRYKVSK